MEDILPYEQLLSLKDGPGSFRYMAQTDGNFTWGIYSGWPTDRTIVAIPI